MRHGSGRCRLDRENMGFIRLRDWGVRDGTLPELVSMLTARYMRKHLALPSAVSSGDDVQLYGRRLRAKEIDTMKQVRAAAQAAV
jgi:hypothetical protein